MLRILPPRTVWLRAVLLITLIAWIMLGSGLNREALPKANAQGSGKGMLAVIGNDGNLSILDANGQNPFAVTKDASPERRSYSWPTWATDGRLAFFGTSTDLTDPYRLRMFVEESVKPGGSYQTAYSSVDEQFTYPYWSPGDCLSGNCRDLALLYTPPGSSNLAVRMIRDNGGKFSNKVIGQASPFYYSFSADGHQMLWYRQSNKLEIYNVEQDTVTQRLDDVPGQFQSPMWSPVDDRLLFGVAGTKADTTDLVIAKGADRQVLLKGLDVPISFAWSPDASQIATVSAYSHLVILDVKTGQTVATSPQSNVVAQFWSPQGDRVAYVALNRDQSGVQARYHPNGRTEAAADVTTPLAWFVMDAKTGKSTALANFAPTQEMVYYLNFFDQFDRSHRLWSPDGRYIVYGSQLPTGSGAVMLLDTQNGSNPIKVADGTIGIWSWN